MINPFDIFDYWAKCSLYKCFFKCLLCFSLGWINSYYSRTFGLLQILYSMFLENVLIFSIPILWDPSTLLTLTVSVYVIPTLKGSRQLIYVFLFNPSKQTNWENPPNSDIHCSFIWIFHFFFQTLFPYWIRNKIPEVFFLWKTWPARIEKSVTKEENKL